MQARNCWLLSEQVKFFIFLGWGGCWESHRQTSCIKAPAHQGCSQASSFFQSHDQTVNNSCLGFHRVEQILSSILMTSLFYLHKAFDEIRSLTQLCTQFLREKTGGLLSSLWGWWGALVLQRLPKLLSCASELFALVTWCDFSSSPWSYSWFLWQTLEVWNPSV